MRRVNFRVILVCITFFSLTLNLFSFEVSAENSDNVFDAIEKGKTLEPGNSESDTLNPNNPETDTTQLNTGSAVPEIDIWDYIKVLFMLLIVVGLLYFLLRFLNKKSNMISGKDLIQNLGGISLGANKNVQLLKIGDKIFLVGVGENVSLLKEITNKDDVESLVLQYNEKMNQAFVTETWITKLFRLKKLNKNQVSEPVDRDFKEIFEKQMLDLSGQKKEIFELLGKKKEDHK
ncbi:MAG TPA: flagellar biosynthetic protein FliO [Firmicutes bacterium]|nr:flagellar biosynthetic protein FliO [Bacillota bacterium]